MCETGDVAWNSFCLKFLLRSIQQSLLTCLSGEHGYDPISEFRNIPYCLDHQWIIKVQQRFRLEQRILSVIRFWNGIFLEYVNEWRNIKPCREGKLASCWKAGMNRRHAASIFREFFNPNFPLIHFHVSDRIIGTQKWLVAVGKNRCIFSVWICSWKLETLLKPNIDAIFMIL